MAAVRIYKRMREWWRDPNEVVEGADQNPKNKKLNEAYMDNPEEEEMEAEGELPADADDVAPELAGDEAEAAIPPEVENPEEIVDGVEGESDADEIANQIQLTIDGVTYNLVPAESEAEGGEMDMTGEEMGLDTIPQDQDITQPEVATGEEGEEVVPEQTDEEEAKKHLEAVKARLRKRLEARRIQTSNGKKFNEGDEAFMNGDDAGDVDSGSGDGGAVNAGAVMEKLSAREKALLKELTKIKLQKRSLKEEEYVADPKFPQAKDVNLAATSGPKNAETLSDSGEDFTKKAGSDKSFAARGPGKDIKSAQTISKGVKQDCYAGNDGFNGRGPGQDPKKAYTPSNAGEGGPTGVKGSNIPASKRAEAAKQRILARRMKNLAETEEFNPEGRPKGSSGGEGAVADPIGKAVDNGADQVNSIEDINDTTLEVAENTELFEKLKKIRAARLARRSESAPASKGKLDESVKVTEAFDFKKFLNDEY